MPKIYKTALGKTIDVEHILLKNEHVIAVGNTHTNARGDELGPGGKIIKTRDQIMKEYYALNTPTATDVEMPVSAPAPQPSKPKAVAPVAQPKPEPVVVSPNSGMDEAADFEDQPVAKAPETKVEEPKVELEQAALKVGPSTVKTPAPKVEEPKAPPTQFTGEPKVGAPKAAGAENDDSTPIRGPLASAVAKTATVTQEVKVNPNKPTGVQRF